MSKYKALKKDEVERLSKQVEQWQTKLNTEYNANISVGYMTVALNTLQKQLKGEFPI